MEYLSNDHEDRPMEYLSNDHEDRPNQHQNSHKLYHEMGHPILS